MARYRCWTSTTPFNFYPFLPLVRDEKALAEVVVPWGTSVEWWWRIDRFTITITWTIDPATSVGGNTTYTRTLELARELYDGGGYDLERRLMFPGAETDIAHPYGIGGIESAPVWTHAIYKAFRWYGRELIDDPDDVFESSDLEVEMKLFAGGYEVDPVTGETTVTIKLRVSMTYDDGTEGFLLIQTAPYDLPPPTYFEVDTTATISGNNFAVKSMDTAGEFNETYHFGGAPPVVSIEPTRWYPVQRFDGSEPIVSVTDGTLLGNPWDSKL